MPRFLKPEERRKLIRILSNLYIFTNDEARDRRVFITENAGLGQAIPINFQFSGGRETVAGDLVGRIEELDEIPDRPTYQTLGALLDAMLDLNELNNEDATFIARLIVRYELIKDSAYLEKLLNQYHLTEEITHKSPTQVLLPRPNVRHAIEEPSFEARIDDEQALESIINSADNLLDIHLLVGALYCAQAVARMETLDETPIGTGFLIGPDLLLTNQHVLKEKDYLEEVVAHFGYISDTSGVISTGKRIRMQPDFYYTSPLEELDYALVRLQERPIENIATADELRKKTMKKLASEGKHRGYLLPAPRLFTDYSRVNIIQHPCGQPLKVVMTQNYVVHSTNLRVQYVADTQNKSSGSPVFNQKWEVVALHHSGAPYPSESVTESIKKIVKGSFRVNEGIPMRAILEDFKRRPERLNRFLPRE